MCVGVSGAGCSHYGSHVVELCAGHRWVVVWSVQHLEPAGSVCRRLSHAITGTAHSHAYSMTTYTSDSVSVIQLAALPPVPPPWLAWFDARVVPAEPVLAAWLLITARQVPADHYKAATGEDPGTAIARGW